MWVDRFGGTDRGFQDLSSCNLAIADKLGKSEAVIFSVL